MNNLNLKEFTKAFALSLLVLILPDLVFALDPIGDTLCALVTFMQSTPVKAAATAAIVFLGVAAFFGKLNWGLAVAIALGVMFMFGAVTIVDFLGTGVGGVVAACT